MRRPVCSRRQRDQLVGAFVPEQCPYDPRHFGGERHDGDVEMRPCEQFTLVPWRPALDRHPEKQVTGVMKGDGINWAIGRGRGGPSVS